MRTDEEAVAILDNLTEDTVIDTEEAREALQGMMKQVLDRCEKDIEFFFRHFVYIQSFKTEEYELFQPNAGQMKVIDTYNTDGWEKKWIVVSKARQAGFTTLTNAIMFHHVMFSRNATVAIVSQKEDTSKKNLDAIRRMFTSIPWWMWTNCVEWDNSNTGRHSNSSTHLTFHSKVTGTEQQLKAYSASAKAIRGETPTALHWTEVAFCDEAYEMSKAIFPAIRRRSKSLMVLESTSNGTGNFYADTVQKVNDGNESRFKLVFHPWFEDQQYREAVPETFSLTDDEKAIKEKFTLDDEQLVWRRIAIADNNDNLNSFMQEYPSTVEESFIATDALYFTDDVIRQVSNDIEETPYKKRLDYTEYGISHNEYGNTFVWEDPNKSYQYILGADICEGKGKDYAVICVFDPFQRLVLAYRAQERPDIVATIINHIARYYNQARVIVERNGIGNYVISSLQNQYRYANLYNDADGRVGFRTQEHSRKRILARMQEDIAQGQLKAPWPDLLLELPTFEISDSGKPQAKKGCHDDTIMSLAITNELFNTHRPQMRDEEEFEIKLPRRSFVL